MPFAGRPFPVPFGSRPLAISPDASTVALASTSGLQIRRMDQNDAVSIPTGFASNPFFSPDGQWIGSTVVSVVLNWLPIARSGLGDKAPARALALTLAGLNVTFLAVPTLFVRW